MKVCVKCRCSKEESEFSFRCKSKGILSNTCKMCQRSYAKNHYSENKLYYIKKAGNRRSECLDSLRKKMFEFLKGKKCMKCGESDVVVLEFDHKNADEKDYTISYISSRSWKKTLLEIKKCDILCANCHRRKTARDRNWYRFAKSV